MGLPLKTEIATVSVCHSLDAISHQYVPLCDSSFTEATLASTFLCPIQGAGYKAAYDLGQLSEGLSCATYLSLIVKIIQGVPSVAPVIC